VQKNILVDGAHNQDSLTKLKQFVDDNLKNKFEKIFWCFSLKK
jgi:folylpolyglutamate synthase/dihydropteroate synthase